MTLTVITPLWAYAQQLPTEEEMGHALHQLNELPPEEKNQILGAMGIPDMSDLSMSKIAAWIIFGSIGFIAFVYGKKQEELRPLFVGLALMVYPYFFTSTLWLYVVGIALCFLLYFWRG